MKTVPQTAFRLEERAADGTVVISLLTLDRVPLTADTGWEVLRREVLAHPRLYTPHSGLRLVLLGPDRTGAGR